MIQEIAQTYGNGTVHLTSRQGFEIPGIPFDKIPEVNAKLQPIIETLGINQPEKIRDTLLLEQEILQLV